MEELRVGGGVWGADRWVRGLGGGSAVKLGDQPVSAELLSSGMVVRMQVKVRDGGERNMQLTKV
jgi:hypothetical protein